MKYSIKVNEVRAKDGSNIKGFATVVFGDSFKITNIAILENKEKGELFVSMPRYRSNERDEKNSVIYKDVCNPNIRHGHGVQSVRKVVEKYNGTVSFTDKGDIFEVSAMLYGIEVKE